jgi:hypothetical protein
MAESLDNSETELKMTLALQIMKFDYISTIGILKSYK